MNEWTKFSDRTPDHGAFVEVECLGLRGYWDRNSGTRGLLWQHNGDPGYGSELIDGQYMWRAATPTGAEVEAANF